MRDLSILLLLLAFVPLIFRHPWTGVLALAVFDYLNPHAYGGGVMNEFPVSKLLFATVVVAMVVAVGRGRLALRPPPLDWRLLLLILLLAWFVVTSLDAKAPWLVWTRFREFAKMLAVLALTLVLIDTREKLFALIAIIALSFALVAFKGGYWAFTTGFQDRVYGPPGTAFYDNNHFAVAAAMTLPLLTLVYREARGHLLRALLLVMMGVAVAAALSSWSRGGLIALVPTLVFLSLFSRRRLLTGSLLLLVFAGAIALLPADWFARMATLGAPGGDESSWNRLTIWRLGVEYALESPWTGSGFEGWMYVGWRGAELRDWHSAYVEVLAEHGFVGLVLWSGLLFGSIAALVGMAWRYRAPHGPEWIPSYAAMIGLALLAYALGAAFLGIAYWPIFFHLVLLSAVLTRLARRETAGATARPRQDRHNAGIALAPGPGSHPA